MEQMITTNLLCILKENNVYENFFTHVSLINPKGRYSLNRSILSKFWAEYCKIICTNNDKISLGLAESPQEYIPILVDVDLKIVSEDFRDKYYTDDFTTALIKIYQKILKSIVKDITEKDLTCVLLEKKAYNPNNGEDEKENLFKNGFHLHFPHIFLSRIDQEIHLIPRVKKSMLENEFGIVDAYFKFSDLVVGTDTIDKLIDISVLRNCWLLYGSKKHENMDSYKVSSIFGTTMEDDDIYNLELYEAFSQYILFDEDEELIEIRKDNVEFLLPRILSILPYGRKVFEVRTDGIRKPEFTKFIFKKKSTQVMEDTRDEKQVSDDLLEVSELLHFLNQNRSDDRNNWMTIGWAIYNTSKGSDEGLDLWLDFSKKSTKFVETKCIYEWSNMGSYPNGVTIGTLKYFAKQDNPDKYSKYIYTKSKISMKKELYTSHYDLAILLHSQYSNEFVYTDNGWYQFGNHFWQTIENGLELRSKISNDLVSFFNKIRSDIYRELSDLEENGESNDKDRDTLEKKQKEIARIIGCLKNTPFKNNIMKECQEVFHNREFINKLNTNRYLIGFKNGVYDLEQNIFRDGLPTDYISTRMPICYKEYTRTDPLVQEVFNFFEKVFADTSLRRYFLDVMSEIFVGYNHRKHVYFWTGEGDNGKSITQMFFEKMMGPLSIKGPTTMITSRRPNAGAANAELSRAGNGVRSIFLEEPDPDEEIFTGVFKHLSGNDSIYTRDLFQAGKNVKEIIPMFKLFVICNKLPKVRKGGDKATWNRIRVIPFESTFKKIAPATFSDQLYYKTFPVDTNFAQKIPQLVEPLAWLLLQHRLEPKIEDPEKVTIATDQYKMKNDLLYLFSVHCIKEEEGGILNFAEFYNAYKEWMVENMGLKQILNALEFAEYFEKRWGTRDDNDRWIGRKIKPKTEDFAVHKQQQQQVQTPQVQEEREHFTLKYVI